MLRNSSLGMILRLALGVIGILSTPLAHATLNCVSLVATAHRVSQIEKHVAPYLHQQRGNLPENLIRLDADFYHARELHHLPGALSEVELTGLRQQISFAFEFYRQYQSAIMGSWFTLFPIRHIEFRSHRYLNDGRGRQWWSRSYDYLPESGTLVVGLRDTGDGFQVRTAQEIRLAVVRGDFLRDEHIPVSGLKRKKFKILWQLLGPLSPLRLAVRQQLLPRLQNLAAGLRAGDPLLPKLSEVAGQSQILNAALAQAAQDAKNLVQHRRNQSFVSQYGLINVSSVDNVSVLDGVSEFLALPPAVRAQISDRLPDPASSQNDNRIVQWGLVNVSTLDNIQVFSDLLGGLAHLRDDDLLRFAAALP